MTDIYTELQAEASELLEEFAQGTITLTRTTQTPDAATPYEPGTPATTTYTLNAVVSGMPKKFIDGTLILASDLLMTAAVHASVTPTMGDKVTVDGREHAIKKIEPTPAAGTPVANLIFLAG